MTLTAGATLQNGKYVIQSTLKQSDFSITYRAVHFYLEQPVIIQTFNDSLRHHANFDQLRQLFIGELRRWAKASDGPIKVLDGFEEAGIPYLVMPYGSDQSFPKLRDWLPVSKVVVQPPAPSEADSVPPANSTNGKVAPAAPGAIAPHPIPEATPSTNGKTAPVTPAASHHSIPAAVDQAETNNGAVKGADQPAINPGVSVIPGLTVEPINPQRANPALTNGVALPGKGSQRLGGTPSQAKPKPNRLLPIALGITALIGGFSGVAFGWMLRFSPATPVSTDGKPASIFDFNDEQSFPAQDNWPITDTSELESADNNWDNSVYEAPVRRDRPTYDAAPEWSAPAEEVPYSDPDPVPEEAAPYEEVAPEDVKVVPPEQFSEEGGAPVEEIPPEVSQPPVYEPPVELPPKPAIEEPPAAVNSIPEPVVIPPDGTLSQ